MTAQALTPASITFAPQALSNRALDALKAIATSHRWVAKRDSQDAAALAELRERGLIKDDWHDARLRCAVVWPSWRGVEEIIAMGWGSKR